MGRPLRRDKMRTFYETSEFFHRICRWVGARARRIQRAERPAPRRPGYRRTLVPVRGPGRRQPSRVDRGRAGRSVDLLRGRGVGRRVEDHRRRPPLDTDLRQHAGRGDWRARGRALRSERRVGGHRRSVGHSRQRRDWRRHLQVGRRRTHVDAHGLRRDRPHRPHPRASDEPGHCHCVRDRTHHGSAAGARRVPHDRRRRALGSRVVRRREHRMFGTVDGREESADALRRHVAGGDASVGDAERRAGQRHLRLARRRREVDEGRGCGPSAIAARQD